MLNRKFKQICCGALSAAMVAAVPACAFAAETEILFTEDFEKADSLNKIYHYTADYATKDNGSNGIDSNHVSVKTASDWESNFMEVTPTGKRGETTESGYAKIFFNKAISKENGTLIIEFDEQLFLKVATNNWSGLNGNKGISFQRTDESRAFKNGNNRVDMLNFQGSNGGGNVDGFFIYDFDTNAKTYVKRKSGENTSKPVDALWRNRDKWNHIKMVLDMKTGEYTLFVNGIESIPWKNKDAYNYLAQAGDFMDSLVFYSHHGDAVDVGAWNLDNIKVYIPAPDPEKITVNTYDGKTADYSLNAGNNTLKNPVSTMLDNLTVNFGSKVTDGVTATLKNNTTDAEEPVTLTIAEDGKTGTVTVDKKYVDANNSYTLTLSGTDAAGNSFTKPTVINFTADNDGGLNILSTEITPTELAGLKSGDTVTATVKYVLTDVNHKKDNVILAVTGEKANKLLYFGQTVKNFDQVGANTVNATFTVGDNIPDKLSAFVWDSALRSPVASFVTLP